MNKIGREVRTGVLLFMAFCVLAVTYTLVVTVGAWVFAPHKSAGSLLTVDGKIVGSEFIGQSFTSPRYFHGRPSAVDYRGDDSGGSNYGPTSARLMELVGQRIERTGRPGPDDGRWRASATLSRIHTVELHLPDGFSRQVDLATRPQDIE